MLMLILYPHTEKFLCLLHHFSTPITVNIIGTDWMIHVVRISTSAIFLPCSTVSIILTFVSIIIAWHFLATPATSPLISVHFQTSWTWNKDTVLLYSVQFYTVHIGEGEVTQSCPTLWNPVDCSLSGSSVHGVFQARVLEWIAISFSRGSSRPRNRTRISRIAGRCFTVWATGEALLYIEHKGTTNYRWFIQLTMYTSFVN